MVESGLCTDSQYESGVIKLVDRMSCALENLDDMKHDFIVSDHNKVNNNCKNDKEVVFQLPSTNKAAKDIE